MRLFYTKNEGGKFFPWPEGKDPPSIELVTECYGHHLIRRFKTIPWNGINFHSLAVFNNNDLRTNRMHLRWDLYNGFTQGTIKGYIQKVKPRG